MFDRAEFVAYGSYLVTTLREAWESKPSDKLASIIKSAKMIIDYAHKMQLENESIKRENQILRHEKNRVIQQLKELRDEN